MMNIQVNGAQAAFVDGVLTLQYFNVIFNAGDFPNRIDGSLQVTAEDGVTIDSSEDEVRAAAIEKIKLLIDANDHAA